MDLIETFNEECKREIEEQGNDDELKRLAKLFLKLSDRHKYSYHFTWQGRPIIQFPEDIIAMQEIIWKVKPELIIETGIAHGGSLLYYASMLELLGENGLVVGVDIDIREYNRREIEKSSLYKRIQMIEGSSIDVNVIEKIKKIARDRKKVMVVLDSCHTHEHVLNELKMYSPLVTKGSYLIVFDTAIEDMEEELCSKRPWGKGNNPQSAVKEFLKINRRFVVDVDIENKLLITVAPHGYLKCVEE